MSHATATDQVATHDEVIAQRTALRLLAREHGLAGVRVSGTGTVIVHSDSPGYRAVRRFATAASRIVGAWVNVITDEVPAAQVDAAPL